jgi:hypothetical protein
MNSLGRLAARQRLCCALRGDVLPVDNTIHFAKIGK